MKFFEGAVIKLNSGKGQWIFRRFRHPVEPTLLFVPVASLLVATTAYVYAFPWPTLVGYAALGMF